MLKREGNITRWVGVAMLLIVFIIASFVAYTPAPKEYPAFVSESPSPSGTKAIYSYMKKEAEKVTKWTMTPDHLPSEVENQTLLMIQPSLMLDSEEMGKYRRFIEAGNTVVLLDSDPQSMFEIKTEMVEVPSELATIEVTDGTTSKAEIASSSRLMPDQGDKTLLKDAAGVLALKRPMGKGRLVVSVTPEWVMNGKILEHDHLPLFFVLMKESGSEAFYFDEYIHGVQTANDLLAVYPQWFIVLMGQLLLFAILLMWMQGKRFGPVYTIREESVRFSDEAIHALAAWHMRGKLYSDSLAFQADYVKFAIQERWGIAYAKTWLDMADDLAEKVKTVDGKEIKPFVMELVKVLQRKQISKQEYLLWSKYLDRLQKEVEEG